MKVAQFKDTSEGEVGGFIANGEQTIDNEKFLFENRGLLATNGRILIFHGAVKESESSKNGDTISKIITSFSLDKN